MKLEDLLQDRAVSPSFPPDSPPSADDGAPAPGDERGAGSAAPAPPPPEEFVTETAPSGIHILYQWAPKRLYRISNHPDVPGIDVPSVTTVLGVLDKSGPLVWWAMKVGIDGVLALLDKTVVRPEEIVGTSVEELVQLLTEHKLTVNHVKDAAADRGVNVHSVLESWAEDGSRPFNLEAWPEHERGYVEGLDRFFGAISHKYAGDSTLRAEVMVGSLEHLYAGRYDLRLTLTEPVELVTKSYPKKQDRVETVPAGSYLLDLKTSKRVYDTHFLQLEAYEKASVECGYDPTDYRGVVHVTEDGRYELVLNTEWTFDDFAVIRKAYAVMKERDKLKNEREVEQALRDELGAKDAA